MLNESYMKVLMKVKGKELNFGNLNVQNNLMVIRRKLITV